MGAAAVTRDVEIRCGSGARPIFFTVAPPHIAAPPPSTLLHPPPPNSRLPPPPAESSADVMRLASLRAISRSRAVVRHKPVDDVIRRRLMELPIPILRLQPNLLLHKFKDPALEKAALAMDADDIRKVIESRRLAILGDGMLKGPTVNHIFNKYPSMDRKDFSFLSSVLVSNRFYAQLGVSLGINTEYVESEISHKAIHTRGDLMEAYAGAVFMDIGVENMPQFFKWWGRILDPYCDYYYRKIMGIPEPLTTTQRFIIRPFVRFVRLLKKIFWTKPKLAAYAGGKSVQRVYRRGKGVVYKVKNRISNVRIRAAKRRDRFRRRVSNSILQRRLRIARAFREFGSKLRNMIPRPRLPRFPKFSLLPRRKIAPPIETKRPSQTSKAAPYPPSAWVQQDPADKVKLGTSFELSSNASNTELRELGYTLELQFFVHKTTMNKRWRCVITNADGDEFGGVLVSSKKDAQRKAEDIAIAHVRAEESARAALKEAEEEAEKDSVEAEMEEKKQKEKENEKAEMKQNGGADLAELTKKEKSVRAEQDREREERIAKLRAKAKAEREAKEKVEKAKGNSKKKK